MNILIYGNQEIVPVMLFNANRVEPVYDRMASVGTKNKHKTYIKERRGL